MTSQRDEDDLDLLRYGRFLASYSPVLAGCALAGAIAGLAIGAWLPPRFQSTATLALTPPGAPTAVVLTPASAKALIASQTIVSETLKESGLEQDGITPQAFVDDALDVQPVPSTNLVKLSVTLTDAARAQRAADLLAKKVVGLTLRIDRETGISTRKNLDEEIAEARTARDKAEREFLEFQTRADLEGTLAQVEQLQREHRDTSSQRAVLYRKRLDIERLHMAYLSREGVYSDLVKRRDDARTRPLSPTQVQVVDAPILATQPLPRRRLQLATLGALVGLAAGVIVALLINKRRVERSLRG